MTTKQKLILGTILLLALLVRIHLRADTAFYCDVPASLAAMESGRMIIQFPGYAPYHNLIIFLTHLTGLSAATIMSWVALFCGYGALLYTARLLYSKAGAQACLFGSVAMGVSVFPVYFSCVRATYVMDMLASAGLLAHGSAFLQQHRSRDYYGALGWFCLGCLMRPLSFPCTGLALAYLLLQAFSWKRCLLTAASLLLTGLLFASISLPYYGSLPALLASPFELGSELQSFSLLSFLTNTFRFVVYPLWGLHAYLLLAIFTGIRHRPSCRSPQLRFLLLIMGPYLLLLLRYIPHAGYYALLLPGLVALPWFLGAERLHLPLRLAPALACVFLAQLYLVRTVPVTGPVTLVGNAYLFQYTAKGLQAGMFETLSSLANKTGVLEEQIPPQRRSALDRLTTREPATTP